MPTLSSSTVAAQGGGPSPQVWCAWSLVDADGDAATGFVYGPDAAVGQVPTAPGTPCVYDPVTGIVSQPAGVGSMLQVRPNAGDAPSLVSVELWAAVDHPAAWFDEAGGVVDFVVIAPDGSEHVRLAGSPAACQGEVVPGAMWTAASTEIGGAGAVAWSAVTNGDDAGLWDRCRQGAVALHRTQWAVSNTDPCGSYTVVTVASVLGATTVFDHAIDVVCFIEVGIDFTSLDFADLAGGRASEVRGDRVFGTADAPSVVNRGNAAMRVGLSLTPMVNPRADVAIEDFSAGFGRGEEIGRFDGISAGPVHWFDADAARTDLDPAELVLCANEVGRLDVVAHPPLELPEGRYAGGFTVWGAIADTGCGSP